MDRRVDGSLSRLVANLLRQVLILNLLQAGAVDVPYRSVSSAISSARQPHTSNHIARRALRRVDIRCGRPIMREQRGVGDGGEERRRREDEDEGRGE